MQLLARLEEGFGGLFSAASSRKQARRITALSLAFGFSPLVSLTHITSITAPMSEISPATLRRHYEQAATDKAAGEKFYNLLHGYQQQDALVLGYKAASEAIKARDASMLSKLTYVQNAARTFEQAVGLNPGSAEIRFLRFSVESNLPPFLGLSKHVDEDKAFLLQAALQHPGSGMDAEAFRTVRGFLVGRGHVSETDAGRLAQVKE